MVGKEKEKKMKKEKNESESKKLEDKKSRNWLLKIGRKGDKNEAI